MGQSNLLDLLLLSKRNQRSNKRNYDGEMIDLTSDGEDECSMANGDEKVIKDEETEKSEGLFVKEEEDNTKEHSVGLDQVTPEVQESDLTPDLTETIPCPVCQLNISKLTLSDRESHVELCLLQPTTHKSIVAPSPKKSKPKQESSKPKKPRQPKPRTKPIPDFKILTFKNNHKINVDGFQFMDHPEVDQYFLSHYHSDHYIGLGKNWNQGKIYTSKTTSNLLQTVMKIPQEKIVALPFNEPFKIHENIEVILYDANHCPGGAIFLFQEFDPEKKIIKRILHTGDFRVSLNHINLFKHIFIDEIYLDTTYLNPVYTFMPQRKVVSRSSNFIANIINQTIRKNSILNYFKESNDYLIIIGAYSIGKEKLYINLAKTIKSKILITKDRYKMLSCIDGFTDLDIFQFEESKDCKIQIVSINKLTDLKFLSKFQNKKIIKIKPTGWSFNTFKKDTNIKDLSFDEILQKTFINNEFKDFENQLSNQFQKSSSLSIPYSEHSSFKELSIFASFLKWGEIIPTVNIGNEFFPKWFEIWKNYELDEFVVNEYFKE